MVEWNTWVNFNFALARKRSILEVWCIEKKMFVCPHFTHIWHYFCRIFKFWPGRPSRFWDAYYYKTINFREKNYQTKNVCLHHKTYVLKFDNVSSNDVWGRPSFVRVTFFPFFGYNYWSNWNLDFRQQHLKELPKIYQIHLIIFRKNLFTYLKSCNFMKKGHFYRSFFHYFPL